MLILLSCSTEYGDEISVSDKVDQFTVYQAKEYYEVNFPTTRSSDFNNEYLCTSFTPLWENSKYTKAANIESIDVPINKKTDFVVQKGKNFIVAPQRLTIIKDNATEIVSFFLTTFIPDAKFLKIYNTSDYDPQLFETSGDKGYYSGLVIYTPTTSSEIALINVYKNGKKIDSANIFSADASENKVNIVKMGKLLKGIHAYPSIKPL